MLFSANYFVKQKQNIEPYKQFRYLSKLVATTIKKREKTAKPMPR